MSQWAPGRYTVLFFHDEAVALAAGHRPCALCRRDAYQQFRAAWVSGRGDHAVPSAAEMDRQLHGERIIRGTHQRRWHPSNWPDLPSGAFVRIEDQPALVLDDVIVPWTPKGYAAAQPRPRAGTVQVITPPSTVRALAGGHRPQIDRVVVLNATPQRRR